MQVRRKDEEAKVKYLMDREIYAGKYKGKTLSWIIANDDSYWTWMKENGLPEKWKLIDKGQGAPPYKPPLPGTPEARYYDDTPAPWLDIPEIVPKPRVFRTEDAQYIGIREVPVPPSDNKWISMASDLLGELYMVTEGELRERIRELLYMPYEETTKTEEI